MTKNCPECGKFMKLVPFEAVGKDPWTCYQWWSCDDEEGKHFYEVDPIPAPEYQWLWNCEGIPGEALIEWPELMAEYTEMWDRLPKKEKRLYAEQAPDLVIEEKKEARQ